MKELIAQATLCKDKAELVKFLQDQSDNEALSKSIKSKFEYLLTRENADFRAFRTRVINMLQIEEKSALIDWLVQDDSNDDDPKQPKTRNVDHETALVEINITIAAYIRNALDQIAQHKEDPKKNNKEANIIALVHGLNELLDNPEHKQYINLDERLFCDVVKLQNALNEIGLGEVYNPIKYLLSLFLLKPVTYGHTILGHAAIDGNNKLVAKLLEVAKGNDELLKNFFAPDSGGNTALHWAVRVGNKEAVDQLLEAVKGNDELLKTSFTPDKDGYTLLQRALIRVGNYKEIALVLLEAAKGKDELLKNLFSHGGYRDALSVAVCQDSNELVAKLLEVVKRKDERLKLMTPDQDRETPLHFAVNFGNKEMVAQLLEAAKGDDELLKIFFAPNRDGQTPLHLAVKGGHKEVVSNLLEAVKGKDEIFNILFSPYKGIRAKIYWAIKNSDNEIAHKLLKVAKENGILKVLLDREYRWKGVFKCAKLPEIKEVLNDYKKKYLSSTAVSTAAARTDGAQVSVPTSITQQVNRSSSSEIGNSRV